VIVNATVDGATWLASQTVSAATTIAGIAEDIGKWTGKIGYDIGKWAGQQAVNVTKGFLTEAWQLATKGFSETWNLVKASGYTAWWFLSSPYYIIKDPEAWAKTGLNDAWDLFKASASMALWAGLELAPALTGGQNFLGPVTAVGLVIGIAGWIDGGDAPVLNFAGGGLVFEFQNSPFAFAGSAAPTGGPSSSPDRASTPRTGRPTSFST
jgi:hypothetical protein